jgi:transposase
LEAGYTAAWLFAGLQRYGWPVICIDARHAAAALQADFRNKYDRNAVRRVAPVSVRGRGGNSVVSARRAQCPTTWSSARAQRRVVTGKAS